MMRLKNSFYVVTIAALMASCISNDIPYPIVEAAITSAEAEYQVDENGKEGGAAVINKSARTVQMFVDDRVDVKQVRLTRLVFTEEATLSLLDTSLCVSYKRFPRKSFNGLEEGADTRLDCSKPVKIRLTTYQDYDWTLSVTQIIERVVAVDGQIGDAVIDDVNHNVVVYVTKDKDLSKLEVQTFTLGGQHGNVAPDPAEAPAFDFSKVVKLDVRRAYEALPTRWSVYVYQKENDTQTEAEVFPQTVRATVTGTRKSGAEIGIEYRRKNQTAWTTLASGAVTTTGSKFTATIEGLTANTAYVCRALTNGEPGEEMAFSTAPATPLTGGDFDNWHKVGKLWNPWSEGTDGFWDTGNRGATTVGESNSLPTDDTCDGKGQAALLESKYIVLKFAAGSIFTGDYIETDGTNGVLDFGRPFAGGFPSALRVNYKFLTSTINRSADDDYAYMKGQPDSCQIYIALANWTEPYRIRTRPSTRRVFNPHADGVLAYGQITVGSDVPEWKQQDIKLEWYRTDIQPNYIMVVASASKYGDYFTGGDATKLWIDNFSLLYE